MGLFQKRPLLWRYILLFSQAVILPVCIVVFSLLHMSNSLKYEINDASLSSVSLIREALDANFQGLEDTIRTINTSPELNENLLAEKPESAVRFLSGLVSSHRSLQNIFLTTGQDGRIFSATGFFSPEELHAQPFFIDLSAAQDQWLQAVQSGGKTAYFSGSSDYFYLVAPLKGQESSMTGTVTLQIRLSYILDLFRSSQTSSHEGIALLDPSLTPLVGLLSEENLPLSEISQYIADNPQILDDGFAQLPESKYLVFVSQSQETGLCYVRFMPENVAYEEAQMQWEFVLLILSVTVFVGIFVIATGIRRSYAPIHDLASWIRSHQPANGNIHNELVLFRSALDEAFTQNEALSQVVSTSRQGLIDHLLSDLLSGNFPTEAAFREACEKLDVRLDKPYFAVCSLLIESDAESVSFQQISNAICKNLPAGVHLQIKELLFANKLILIVNCDTADLAFYKNVISGIQSRLLEQEKLMTSIGMGNLYDSYSKVGKSYMDSVNALDYRLVYGKNCLISPDIGNRSASELIEAYPSYDLELLDAALSAQNPEMAETILRRINTSIKLKSYNLHIAECICYDIFGIIKKNGALFNRAVPLPQPPNTSTSKSHHTVDDYFSAVLQRLRTDLSGNIEPESPSQTKLGPQLVEYADKRCLSYDFQIKTMAEHFAISPQYMRKLFKNHAGMGISEYVANKRLEKSMYLLTKTDLSLQEIVAQIGNSDISGFVRFFKQKTGLTPGQYRKNHKLS